MEELHVAAESHSEELSEATVFLTESSADPQPPAPRVAAEVGTNHRQETVKKNSETSVEEDIPAGLPVSSQDTSISGTAIEEVEAVLSEVLSIPVSNSSITSTEELDNVQLQPEERNSPGVSDVHIISNYTASDELGKPEDSLHVLPDMANNYKEEIANIENRTPESADSSERVKPVQANRGFVDTAAPFESVREAVSMFGGIVDWKAHRAQTLERRKHIQREIEKLQGELPEYKMRSEAAQDAKAQVLTDLNSTKRLIEELKLSLEKAQTEEIQAKQDSELAQLRAREIEQGIADEASVAAKAQLEVAKARHESAVSELKSVKEELEILKAEYVSLVNERDIAIKEADEAVSASKEIEKTVEDLTVELITTKESLESAHAAHLEAEEHRIGAALAKEQDCLNWEKELKQAEDEVQRLNEQVLLAKDLQSKIDTASSLLLDLKAELAAYMESKLKEEAESMDEEKLANEAKAAQTSTQAVLASTRKELDEVKVNIEKARVEVNCLRVAASSLKSELDTEKSALTTMRQREGMASVAVSSLEAEINRTNKELGLVLKKEKEARDKMVELPKLLQQAAQEADQAKAVTHLAREELRKAKEEADLAKASASTMEIRLRATLKEIEASKASERLALAAIQALEESEKSLGLGGEDSPRGVTLPLEEYYILSKRAHEAEELASGRVATALDQIEVAKESELRSLAILEEANKQMDERKESLLVATERAGKAMEGKLGVEQELRKWRADHEQRRRASDAAQVSAKSLTPRESEDETEHMSFGKERDDHPTTNQKIHMAVHTPENSLPESKPRKKKSLIPRIVMFLARKKAESLN